MSLYQTHVGFIKFISDATTREGPGEQRKPTQAKPSQIRSDPNHFLPALSPCEPLPPPTPQRSPRVRSQEQIVIKIYNEMIEVTDAPLEEGWRYLQSGLLTCDGHAPMGGGGFKVSGDGYELAAHRLVCCPAVDRGGGCSWPGIVACFLLLRSSEPCWIVC